MNLPLTLVAGGGGFVALSQGSDLGRNCGKILTFRLLSFVPSYPTPRISIWFFLITSVFTKQKMKRRPQTCTHINEHNFRIYESAIYVSVRQRDGTTAHRQRDARYDAPSILGTEGFGTNTLAMQSNNCCWNDPKWTRLFVHRV